MARGKQEPESVGSALETVLSARGWSDQLATARVILRWPDAVGALIAAHTDPTRLHGDGALEVVAESAIWATQLTFLETKLLQRIDEVCSPGVVRRLRIRVASPTSSISSGRWAKGPSGRGGAASRRAEGPQ